MLGFSFCLIFLILTCSVLKKNHFYSLKAPFKKKNLVCEERLHALVVLHTYLSNFQSTTCKVALIERYMGKSQPKANTQLQWNT